LLYIHFVRAALELSGGLRGKRISECNKGLLEMEAKILAAVSRLESVEYVSLYSIMLAKRTGMDACVLIVLNEKVGSIPMHEGGNGVYDWVRKIKEAGEEADVKVECLITDGVFEHEVADHLKALGSPILVVGEGADLKARREELRRIEKELMAGGSGRKRQIQFMIVSRKGESPDPHNKKAIQGGVR